MKRSLLRVSAILFAAALTGIVSCSGGGEEGGGGCGGAPADTTPKLSCGRGTHQEGNSCVQNTTPSSVSH